MAEYEGVTGCFLGFPGPDRRASGLESITGVGWQCVPSKPCPAEEKLLV
jgi:hypothetical protein